MAEKDARNVTIVTLSDTNRDIKNTIMWRLCLTRKPLVERWSYETRPTLLPGEKVQIFLIPIQIMPGTYTQQNLIVQTNYLNYGVGGGGTNYEIKTQLYLLVFVFLINAKVAGLKLLCIGVFIIYF